MPSEDGSPAPRRLPAYRQVANVLRDELERGDYAEGRRMPTEVELRERFGVGRHTIREALNQLTADGLVRRVQGRGTFAAGPSDRHSRYLRSIGSLDEIIVWPNTDMEVTEPFSIEAAPAIAHRLGVDYVEVARANVRRKFDGLPFVVTDHYVAPDLGKTLRDNDIPSSGEGTVIGAAEPFLPNPVACAQQDITATIATANTASQIGCDPSDAILLIERLYFDTEGKIVEYTMSRFNPRRYSYRMELRRRQEK